MTGHDGVILALIALCIWLIPDWPKRKDKENK